MLIQIGRFKIYPILDGYFYLDRALMIRRDWNQRIKIWGGADLEGRVKLAARCFLVKGSKLTLFDTGIGNPNDPSSCHFGGRLYKDYFGIDQKNGNLISNLEKKGFGTDEINIVTHSHLHLDHTGWNVGTSKEGELSPIFKNAKYVVSCAEWNEKLWRHPAALKSYRIEHLRPIAKTGQLEVGLENWEIEPGLYLVGTGGHTPGHWQLFVESAGHTAVMAGDLIPTSRYLSPGLTMSYDLNQIETVDKKSRFLKNADKYGWLLLFDHDPEYVGGYISKHSKEYKLIPLTDP